MMPLLALLIACSCPSKIDWRQIDREIAEAARKTDAVKADALRKLREELEGIVKRNRAAFERGDR